MTRARALRLLGPAALIALSAACSGSGSGEPPRSDEPDPADAATLNLAVDVPFAALEVPPDSRPHHPEPPERIPLTGWRREQGDQAVVPNPIRTRNLYFFKPSPGMEVVRADGTAVTHRYYDDDGGTFWTYDDKEIRVHGVSAAPADGELFLVYPRATERERTLNLRWSSVSDPADFVRTSIQAGPDARAGLLLPAPGRASWSIEVPPRAELRFRPGLVEPEIRDGAPSDGAVVVITMTAGGTSTTLWEERVSGAAFEPVVVDLSAHAGADVELSVETRPGGDARFDYVFLADPVVATRRNDPRRVFMVFVDTLRVDHVSALGYERDTTPALAKVAARGGRFTQARNVAPWTLPSTRSVLTGNDPEFYFTSDTLQGRLRAAGFSTAMFAGNLYLGSNFGLNRDWGLHHVDLLPHATEQLDRALAWLDQEAGRDVFLLVHLMDPHLPYKEPDAYRGLYVSERPERFKQEVFHRADVIRWRPRTKEERQYIRDRYDNNIRYTDDQLARLYERLRPDDILVFFSDHGEEFWEHGGFEHGHSLFDELLHVPLVVVGPGLEGREIDAPVSLLDVAPTVLDLLDLPTDGMKGSSLVPLIQGDAAAATFFTGRPQAFGRPLYGAERWGVLSEQRKWSTIQGKEALFDLAADPGERHNLVDDGAATDELRAALAEAVGRDVVDALRIAPRDMRKVPSEDLRTTVTVPGGLRAVWVGADPTEASWADLEWTPGADTFTATWPRPYRGGRDVWFVPNRPIAEVLHDVVVVGTYGDETVRFQVPAGKAPDPEDNSRSALMSHSVGERHVQIGLAIGPLPDEGAASLSGVDDELREGLKAMGYVEDDE